MTVVSWRVRCIVYGLRGDRELEQCAALLRGISALYGDGFDSSVSVIDDLNSLQHVAVSLSLPAVEPLKPAHTPFLRMVCSFGEITDEIVAVGAEEIAIALRATLERQVHGGLHIIGRSIAPPAAGSAASLDSPIRIFVSGDRSQVGKSTCCLGLVGSLLRLGYRPEDIGYIKPATQCEQPQLVAKFCRHNGIECCDIGPIVFYSGFTREFLKGNTETSEELLNKARAKIEEVGRGKKIVVIDGVGYPAVGSICGVSNALVANTVQSPVVLVGKKGVGDAVDSFNLNACFFESHGVKVLGAIFNRLPLDGFYSLEKCRESVMQYFDKFQPDKQVYGFIPELLESTASENETEPMVVDGLPCDAEEDTSNIHMTKQEIQHANQVITLFSQSVNVAQLVEDAKSCRLEERNGFSRGFASASLNKRPLSSVTQNSTGAPSSKKSRQEIQAAAKSDGAAGG